jgi:hypothetical protein
MYLVVISCLLFNPHRLGLSWWRDGHTHSKSFNRAGYDPLVVQGEVIDKVSRYPDVKKPKLM